MDMYNQVYNKYENINNYVTVQFAAVQHQSCFWFYFSVTLGLLFF
jgi:hypothetical protein